MLPLDQVATFALVAELGSFSAAARAEGRTQPAVTQSIRGLEARLGYALFDRSAYRPALTVQGRALLPLARRMVGEAKSLYDAAASIAADNHCLTLSLDHSASASQISAALLELKATFPGVQLQCFNDALDGVIQRVMGGECELGIANSFAAMPDGLQRLPVGRVSLALVAGASHPLVATDDVRLEDLRRHEQLVVIGHDGAIASRNFGIIGHRTWRVGSLSLLRSLLLAGFGYAILPGQLLADDLSTGRLHQLQCDALLQDQTASWTSYIVWRAEVPLSPVAQLFIDALSRPFVDPT